MSQARILLFDSGMGGLTVARAVARQLPDAHLVYAADNAGFPYGAWKEEDLVARILDVIGALIEKVEPHVVVIACNTASTIALAQLREAYKLPFVGTVPAIKPAAAQTKSRHHRRAGNPGHGEPRVYPRADPYLCLSLQGLPAWREAAGRDRREQVEGPQRRSR